MPQLEICKAITWKRSVRGLLRPITIHTLQKHFRAELISAGQKANAMVIGNLLKLTATQASACKLWLTNKMGWTGGNEAPMPVQAQEEVDAQADLYETAKKLWFMLQRAAHEQPAIEGEAVRSESTDPESEGAAQGGTLERL